MDGSREVSHLSVVLKEGLSEEVCFCKTQGEHVRPRNAHMQSSTTGRKTNPSRGQEQEAGLSLERGAGILPEP